MKVKCPFCNEKWQSTHMLDAHLQLRHNEMQIRNYYVDLLFKIHEKISLYSDFQTNWEDSPLQVLNSLIETESNGTHENS